MNLLRPVLALCLLSVTLGCEPSPAPDDDPPRERGDPLKVMTYNVYLGTAFESLFDVSSLDGIAQAAAAAWADVQATDFPARAVAIADAIEAEAPALIGLQEVELYRIQSPGDGLGGSQAQDVALDFLDVLMTELGARGLGYRVVAQVANVDVEVPMATDTGSDDIRITDHEVILARDYVEIAAVRQENFVSRASIPVPGSPFPITIPKGWLALEARQGAQHVLFASTHLEVIDAAAQQAQAGELLLALADSELPVVLVGDFNSAPAGGSSATYADIVAAGYGDAWPADGDPGYTCCQASDLANASSTLGMRIDHIFARGEVELLDATRVGHEESSRTSSGLWPSDHAGVVANVR